VRTTSGAKAAMSIQENIILQVIRDRLCARGFALEDEVLVQTMISQRIRRLNEGDYIAVEIDALGRLLAITKVVGFSSLNTIENGAIMISYNELERQFYEQQSASMEL
jgi:hypothetical protein